VHSGLGCPMATPMGSTPRCRARTSRGSSALHSRQRRAPSMSAMSGFWASLRALSSRASSAAYPDAGNDFAHRTLLDHEALKPWTVEEIWMLNGTEPNHYVDVTDTFDQKIEALRAHRSQTGHRIIAPRHSGLTCIPVHPRLR
jgi:hypothetical protein